MAGINKCIIVGNLGDNPSCNTTKSGETVANISVATSEKWRDRNTNEQMAKTVTPLKLLLLATEERCKRLIRKM